MGYGVGALPLPSNGTQITQIEALTKTALLRPPVRRATSYVPAATTFAPSVEQFSSDIGVGRMVDKFVVHDRIPPGAVDENTVHPKLQL